MIDEGTLLDRCENTERHSNRDREEQTQQRELSRCRQAASDFGRHRATGRQRIAEIAVGEIVNVAGELVGQRPVEPERLADFGYRLRGGGRSGEVDGWVARQYPG